MQRYALLFFVFASGLAASHYIRNAHAGCYEPPGAAYIGERPYQPPVICTSYANVTVCQ
jgi:hypothetical protein